MNFYGSVSLMNGLVALFIGIYAFLRRSKNPVYLSFSAMAISIAAWAVFYSVWQTQTVKESALFFMRLTMIPCYFIPFGFLWFSQTICEDNPAKAKIPVYFLAPFLFLLFGFSPWIIQDVVPRLFFPYWPLPGPLMHFCILIFHVPLAWGFWLLFKKWVQSSGMKRWQVRWVTLTLSAMWMGGLTNWFLWYNIPVPPLPNIFVALFLLILAYVIIRRGLFDADALADIVRETKLLTMGMMAASLNHELRNPLYIVKGRIETQLDAIERKTFSSPEAEAAKSRTTLETSLQQISRAMDIVQRFSDFMKVDPKTEVKEKVLIRSVMEDILPLVSSEIEMRSIHLNHEGLDGVAVSVKRRDLEEILFNLIINACQAVKNTEKQAQKMQETKGVIEIRGEEQDGHINILIKDNGPGMAPEQLSKIFEPFYTTKDQGTGLGLYITRQLVEKNGGKISVKSKPGAGTEFTLRFQRSRADKSLNSITR